MSEDIQKPIDGDPALNAGDPEADAEADAEATALATDDGKGNKTVPLSAHIGAQKQLRAAARRIKELEPIAQRVTDLNGRLAQAQPFIDAIVMSPQLKAEALRIASGEGTRRTAEHVTQPADDEEARGHAEDYAMFMADGFTPDVARARRALDRVAGITRRQTEEQIRPLAGLTLGDKAQNNLEQAARMTNSEGVPLATRESIREIAQQMPQQLLANPQVIDLVLNSAIGMDVRKGRSPKPAEPLFLEAQGGRRQHEPSITPEEKRQLERLGLTEKDYAEAGKRLNTGRAIVLGS